MALTEQIKSAGTIVVTALVFILVLVWMVAVWQNLGSVPEHNDDGTLKIDKYARAKDIFVLVLPLLTTAVGFWLGSQGTAKAEEKAAKADEKAVVAEARVNTVQAQKEALLSVVEPTQVDAAEEKLGAKFGQDPPPAT